MNFIELTNEQRRQLIDAQQAFAAWRPASFELEGLGSLVWHTSKGRRYLYEKHFKVQKSLGRETPELVRKKTAHDAKRKALEPCVKQLSKRLDQMSAVNRALNLGRVPRTTARILRALDREGLLGSHLIVAGTNALYAYESVTGTIISSEHVATTDADLVWDNSQSLLLAATGVKRAGIMGILRSVDPTFTADYGLNATNDEGYIVDLLCPDTDDLQRMNEKSDLDATPMVGIQWLLQAPKLEQIVIGEDGLPLHIVVPEPRTFAVHKLWVSQRGDRQPLKRPRDVAQSRVVGELVQKYLRKPFLIKDMPWLPNDLKSNLKHFKKTISSE